MSHAIAYLMTEESWMMDKYSDFTFGVREGHSAFDGECVAFALPNGQELFFNQEEVLKAEALGFFKKINTEFDEIT